MTKVAPMALGTALGRLKRVCPFDENKTLSHLKNVATAFARRGV